MMLVAAAAVAFSCTKKEISDPQADTHTVRFHAFYDATKTVMTETGTVASFEWTKSDEDCFVAFENGVAASEVIGVLNETSGLMEFTATFSHGTAPYTYTAMLNGSVPATQTLYDGKYDEASDVLVAKPVESETAVEDLDLQFKRVVALNKMTIKGLGADELVSTVVISSDKAIAGEYDAINDCWKSSATNTITLDGGDDEGTISDGSGNAVVYFNCIPVADAQLEITVTTDKATYTKTFAKTISLAESTLNKFGVTVEAEEEEAVYAKVTSSLSDWRGDYLIAYSESVFMDGSLQGGKEGVGKAQSHVDPSTHLSTDGKSVDTEWGDEHYVTIEAINGSDLSKGYVIKSHSDTTPYFYQTSNSNGMAATDNKSTAANYPISVVFNDENDIDIALGGSATGAILHYNKTTGSTGEMFRFYKDGGQQNIYLYKRTEPVPVVIVSATGVSLDKTSAEIAVGATETLVATVAPANATNKTVTWKSSNTSVATVADGVVTGVAAGTATITATTEDGGFTATCTVTVKEAQGLSTIDAIFDAATTAGSTAASAKVTFGNWVVSGVKGSNAYVTDGTKGFCIFQSSHGFEAGDILSGTVTCQIVLYNGFAELKGVTSTTTGITVTKGGTVTPQSIAISDLSGINTGAIITLSAVTYNGEAFTDGTNTITPYGTFITLPTMYKGLKYNVKGMYQQYNTTREIAPLSVDDIEEVPVTKYAVNIASGIVNGTVTTNVSQAAAGQEVTVSASPASGYKLSTITVKDASSNNITVTNGKFTMPASAVTVSATFESAGGVKYYVKVTSTDELTDGKYLIIYETGKLAFNSALTTLDAVSNSISVTISGGKIESTTATDAAAFTFTASDGSFLGTGGKYFGNASNSNGLTSSDTALTNTVSLDTQGNADIVSSGGAYLRYNASSGQTRFRYYKSSTYTSQKAIQLYKLEN